MRIALIAAISENGVIGNQNKLPWHIPEELKYFKKVTLGKPIIMGRKTFQSMGSRPLPGRRNIILTHDAHFQAQGAIVVHSLEEALNEAEGAEEVMVIGGTNIFEQFLPKASRLYLTRVHQTVVGDAFFPNIDFSQWDIIETVKGPEFSTQILDKKYHSI